MKKLPMLVLLLLFAVSPPGLAMQKRLAFIEDDSAKALAEASRRKVPVFVDVWAPW